MKKTVTTIAFVLTLLVLSALSAMAQSGHPALVRHMAHKNAPTMGITVVLEEKKDILRRLTFTDQNNDGVIETLDVHDTVGEAYETEGLRFYKKTIVTGKMVLDTEMDDKVGAIISGAPINLDAKEDEALVRSLFALYARIAKEVPSKDTSLGIKAMEPTRVLLPEDEYKAIVGAKLN